MPPILAFLPRLLASAVVFTLLFRLLAAPLDRVSTPARGGRSPGQVAVTPLGFAVRLVLAVLWASYLAWLVTTWTRREDVTYDWFYYLLAGSLYLGPVGLMGRKADAVRMLEEIGALAVDAEWAPEDTVFKRQAREMLAKLQR